MNVLFSFLRRPAANALHAGAVHLEKDQILRVPGAAGWSVKVGSPGTELEFAL